MLTHAQAIHPGNTCLKVCHFGGNGGGLKLAVSWAFYNFCRLELVSGEMTRQRRTAMLLFTCVFVYLVATGRWNSFDLSCLASLDKNDRRSCANIFTNLLREVLKLSLYLMVCIEYFTHLHIVSNLSIWLVSCWNSRQSQASIIHFESTYMTTTRKWSFPFCLITLTVSSLIKLVFSVSS